MSGAPDRSCNMTRALFASFALATVFGLAACGGTIADTNQVEGDVCNDYAGGFACNTSGDTILQCDGSNLWRRAVSCDQGSPCLLSTDDSGAESLCCTVSGEDTCYPQPFSLNILPAAPDAGVSES
jgi:hypothetical protein